MQSDKTGVRLSCEPKFAHWGRRCGRRSTEGEVSGSTLRRHLVHGARRGVLARVHTLLVAMLRGNPTLVIDSCSVRAKRGGELIGSNPTDRGKSGTKYHAAVRGDGVPCHSALVRGCPDSLSRVREVSSFHAVQASCCPLPPHSAGPLPGPELASI